MSENRVNENEQIRQELELIAKYVNRFTQGTTLDKESLVHDIWLEIKFKNIPIYVRHVKHRCIDAIRARKTKVLSEQRFTQQQRQRQKQTNSLKTEQIDLNQIMQMASLTGLEREVIFKYFYKGKTFKEISLEMSLNKEKVEQIKNHTLKKLRKATRFLERKD